jgi:6-pyruvoyl-tetrahydropterin synthase
MKQIQSVQLRHNIEVAHRLTKTPGKCTQIHGHSMWVEMEMWGEVDENGLVEGLEFGAVKRLFRAHLDGEYDHRTLLNKNDPFANPIYLPLHGADGIALPTGNYQEVELPGLAVCVDDPTTENIAKWIGGWGTTIFDRVSKLRVVVHETAVNMASYEYNA